MQQDLQKIQLSEETHAIYMRNGCHVQVSARRLLLQWKEKSQFAFAHYEQAYEYENQTSMNSDRCSSTQMP